MLGALAALIATAAAIAVGLFMVRRWAAECTFASQVALGVCAAAGAFIAAAHLCSLVNLLDATPLVLAAAAFLLRAPSRGRPLIGLQDAAVALLTIGAAWAWFLIPVLDRVVPQGNDPCFHTLIIDLFMRQNGMPNDWGPYDALSPFRYPSGVHAALAAYGRWLGISTASLFTAGLVFTSLTMLITTYALGSRFGGSAWGGALAVALFGFSDGWGTSINHAQWGGLPSLAGLLFEGALFLALAGPPAASLAGFAPTPLAATPGPPAERLRVWLLGGDDAYAAGAGWLAVLFLLASAFAHHLALVLTATCAVTLMGAELLSERRLSPVGQALLRASLWSGAITVLLVVLRRTGRFDLDEAMNFPHALHDFWRSVDVLRPAVFLLGSIGLAACFVLLKGPRERTLLAWAVGLFAFWICFDVGYRLWMFYRHGQNITAFTPTRGLTNLAWPMAIAGAALLARIPGGPALQRALLLGTSFAVAGIGSRGLVERMKHNAQVNPTNQRIVELCNQVRTRLPEDAAIYTPERHNELWLWLAPLCRREVNQYVVSGYAWQPWYAERIGLSSPEQFKAFLRKNGSNKPIYVINYQPVPGAQAAVEAAGMWLYPLP